MENISRQISIDFGGSLLVHARLFHPEIADLEDFIKVHERVQPID